MNKRIVKIRKTVDINQDIFAKRLGLTKNFISLVETGKREPSERTLKDICREFNVSEPWLRTGEGEMFLPVSRSESIRRFADGLMKEDDDSFKRQLVEVLAQLDESEWAVLERIAARMAGKEE